MDLNNVLLMSTVFMLLSVAFMSMVKHVSFLGLLMVLLGFNMGCIDNVANLAIIKLHSRNVSPYIQVTIINKRTQFNMNNHFLGVW